MHPFLKYIKKLVALEIIQFLLQGLLADLVLKLKLQVFSPADYVCRSNIEFNLSFSVKFVKVHSSQKNI